MMNTIKKIIKDEEGRFFILRMLIVEILLVLVLAFVFWLLRDEVFLECFYESLWLMSMAAICHLGIEVFSALGNNHWRFKYANEEYQIYKRIILILINALIFLLIGPKRSYFFFIVPIILWGMLIVIEGIDRFFKS